MNAKKGISLIVLVITIIVIIILASAIIVSIVNNNPIIEANKARYLSDCDSMQAIFTNTMSSIMIKELGTISITAGQINTVTKDAKETIGEVEYTVNNATISANERGTIIFDKGTNKATTYYIGKKLPIYAVGETKWYVDSEGVLSLEVAGVKYGSGEIVQTVVANSAAVANNPAIYYGKKVTNYKTGDATIDAKVEWQIFHSDGNNIYLIATDYIVGSLAPASKAGTALNFSEAYVWFSDVIENYSGSVDITDTALIGLNSKYHAYLTEKGETSTYANMKSVAYMLDTSDEVWGKFAGEDAAYAIGGPTLELFLDSYNSKKETDYQYKVESATGYKVSTDGTSWDTWFTGLATDDTQYVLPSPDNKKNPGEAYGMWLASPSAEESDCLAGVHFNGYFLSNSYNIGDACGLRPLVCLNSDVALEAVDGGFAIK